MNKIINKIITFLFPLDKNKITILFQGYSGSNLSSIIRLLDKEEDYNIKVIQNYNDNSINQLSFVKKVIFKSKRRLSIFWNLSTSQLVITTHGHKRYNNKTNMLNLWHGIPIKSMGLMRKERKDKVGFIDDDVFISTSVLFNTIMNSCMGIYGDKYLVTGYPRNDLLVNSNGKNNLKKVVDGIKLEKIIFYMPTYSSCSNDETNLPGFETFDLEMFEEFLLQNNFLFIMKLHPADEKIFYERTSKFDFTNIKVLKTESLNEKNIDLYEVLNSSDLLVTDYSSVYFDYLLLDKPIIFNTQSLEFYREDRGILLEPYEFWTPGEKVNNQEELQQGIYNNIHGQDNYHKDREMIKDLLHQYQDANSTERVMQTIHKLMS